MITKFKLFENDINDPYGEEDWDYISFDKGDIITCIDDFEIEESFFKKGEKITNKQECHAGEKFTIELTINILGNETYFISNVDNKTDVKSFFEDIIKKHFRKE